MNWNDVASAAGPLLTKNAPLIGSLLGGLIPIPGGSAIGSEVGAMLANAFGVANTPEAVSNAINSDPNAAAKVAAAEDAAQSKWPALAQIATAQFQSNAAQSDNINATMRAELSAGQKWWSWRNVYGYSVGIEATATSWVILYSLVWNPTIFHNVSDSLSFFLSWYGMRFGLLGYIQNQASSEKVAAVTGQPIEGVISKAIKAVKGK